MKTMPHITIEHGCWLYHCDDEPDTVLICESKSELEEVLDLLECFTGRVQHAGSIEARK